MNCKFSKRICNKMTAYHDVEKNVIKDRYIMWSQWICRGWLVLIRVIISDFYHSAPSRQSSRCICVGVLPLGIGDNGEKEMYLPLSHLPPPRGSPQLQKYFRHSCRLLSGVSDVNIKHPFSDRFILNTKCQTEASFIALSFIVELNDLKPSYADFHD